MDRRSGLRELSWIMLERNYFGERLSNPAECTLEVHVIRPIINLQRNLLIFNSSVRKISCVQVNCPSFLHDRFIFDKFSERHHEEASEKSIAKQVLSRASIFLDPKSF